MTGAIARILLVACLAGCSAASGPPPAKPDYFEILEGSWGWLEGEGLTCAENPHTITVAADRKSMVFRHATPLEMADGNTTDTSRYRVIEQQENRIRMSIDGERRRTPSGELVVWDLVLLTNDGYCWHRTDWAERVCTQLIVRCH